MKSMKHKIITGIISICLLVLPLQTYAAQPPANEGIPLAQPLPVQEYTTSLITAPDVNKAWFDKGIILTLGEQQWGCSIADLGAMQIHVLNQNGIVTGELVDNSLLKIWIQNINSLLMTLPAKGNEVAFDRNSGTYVSVAAGSLVQIRYEFAELLQQALNAQLVSQIEPADIRIDLNAGFLVTVPAGGAGAVTSTCTTTLSGSSKSRINNITIGASRLNNVILMPGESLSVSDKLLPRTRANGYEMASVYLDGESVPGLGGGICQLSSTLYNAVMNSGLEVVKRYPHSMIVSYLAPGLDAAIAAGSKDLVIRNNYELPVMIMAEVQGKNLVMSIYMNQELLGGKTYKLWSKVPKTNVADTYLSTYLNGAEIAQRYVGRSNYMPHK